MDHLFNTTTEVTKIKSDSEKFAEDIDLDPPSYGLWTDFVSDPEQVRRGLGEESKNLEKISWTQLILSEFLTTAPKKVGLIYIKETKMILPDFYSEPIMNDTVNDHLNQYLRELKFDTDEGHKRTVCLAAFILAAVYTFDTEKIRIRIFSLKDHGHCPREGIPNLRLNPGTKIYVAGGDSNSSQPPFTLPPTVDMANDEQYQDSELWDDYASFEEVSCWDLLENNQDFSIR